MIFFGTDATAFSNFHRHGATHNISTGQILGGRSVSFHEAFAFCVAQNTTFSSASFRHETTRTVNTRRMELHKFMILTGQSLANGHGVTVAGARVGRSTGKVGTTISPRRQDGILGLDAVNGPVFHVHGHDTDTSSVIIHD